MFRPWAVRGVGWGRGGGAFYLLLLGLSPVLVKGCDFGHVGANDGHAGVLHKLK